MSASGLRVPPDIAKGEENATASVATRVKRFNPAFVSACMRYAAKRKDSRGRNLGYPRLAEEIAKLQGGASLSVSSLRHLAKGSHITEGPLEAASGWMLANPALTAAYRAKFDKQPGPRVICSLCGASHRGGELSRMLTVATASGFCHHTPAPPLVHFGEQSTDGLGLLPGLVMPPPSGGGLILRGISRETFEAERSRHRIGPELIEPVHQGEEREDLAHAHPGDGPIALFSADNEVVSVRGIAADGLPIAGRLFPPRRPLRWGDRTLAAVLCDSDRGDEVGTCTNLGHFSRVPWRAILAGIRGESSPVQIRELVAGERLVSVSGVGKTEDLICRSRFGRTWRIPSWRVPVRGFGAPMASPLELEGDDRIVFVSRAPKNGYLLGLDGQGTSGLIAVSSVVPIASDKAERGQFRPTAHVPIVNAVIEENDEVTIVTRKQRGIRLGATEIISLFSETRAVRLIDTDVDDEVIAAITHRGG